MFASSRRRVLSLVRSSQCRAASSPPQKQHTLNAIQKRVVALQALHERYEAIEAAARVKTRVVERQLMADAAPLFARRRELIAGADATGAEMEALQDYRDDVVNMEQLAAVGPGIPNFWSDLLSTLHIGEDDGMSPVNERDLTALEMLVDVRLTCEVDAADESAELLTFEFEFDSRVAGALFAPASDLVLSTTVKRDIGSQQLISASGCKLRWASDSTNPTLKHVEVESKVTKNKKGNKGKALAKKRTKAIQVHSIFRLFTEIKDFQDGFTDAPDDDGDEPDEDYWEYHMQPYVTEKLVDYLEKQIVPHAGRAFLTNEDDLDLDLDEDDEYSEDYEDDFEDEGGGGLGEVQHNTQRAPKKPNSYIEG